MAASFLYQARWLVTLLLVAAIAAAYASSRSSAAHTSGQICKVSFAPTYDVAIDFITHGSCTKFLAFARASGRIHRLPRTALYGEPRCAFATSATSEVGAGVIVYKSRSTKSVAVFICGKHGITPGYYHYKGWRRVTILYAAAAAATVGG